MSDGNNRIINLAFCGRPQASSREFSFINSNATREKLAANFKERELIQNNRINFEKMKKNLMSKKKINDNLNQNLNLKTPKNSKLNNHKLPNLYKQMICPYINNIDKMRKDLQKALNPKQQLEKIRTWKMNSTFDKRNFKIFKNQKRFFYKSFDNNLHNNFHLTMKNSPQKSINKCKLTNIKNSDEAITFSFRSRKFQNNIKMSVQDKPYHKNLNGLKYQKILLFRNNNSLKPNGSFSEICLHTKAEEENSPAKFQNFQNFQNFQKSILDLNLLSNLFNNNVKSETTLILDHAIQNIVFSQLVEWCNKLKNIHIKMYLYFTSTKNYYYVTVENSLNNIMEDFCSKCIKSNIIVKINKRVAKMKCLNRYCPCPTIFCHPLPKILRFVLWKRDQIAVSREFVDENTNIKHNVVFIPKNK